MYLDAISHSRNMDENFSEYCILLINFIPDDEIFNYFFDVKINALVAENLSELNVAEIEQCCVIIIKYDEHLLVFDSFIEILKKQNKLDNLIIFAELKYFPLLAEKYPNTLLLIDDEKSRNYNKDKILKKLKYCISKRTEEEFEERYKKLEEKAELYRTILNSSPEPVIMIDEQGTILGSNDYADNIMIRRLDSYLGKNLYDLISIGLSSMLRVYTKKAKLTKLPVNFLFKHYDYVIEYTIVPVYNDESTCKYIIFREDQTEREFAERALKFNVDLLTNVLNSLPVMVWHVNHNFVIKLVLGAIENIELFQDMQVGEQVSEMLRSYPQFYRNILEASRNRKRYSIEQIGDKYIENFYSAKFDELNNFSGLTIVSNDITEKIKAETELDEERRKLQFAFSMSFELFWEFDFRTNTFIIHKVNGDKIYNFPPPKISGREFLKYCFDDEIPYLKKLYISFKRGEITSTEFFLKMRDYEGRELWYENKVAVFEYDDITKRPAKLLGASRDVSDIVKVENEIHKYRNMLESIINRGNIYYVLLDREMRVVTYNKNVFDKLLSTFNIYLRYDADFKKFLKETELSKKVYNSFLEALSGQEVHFEYNYIDYVGGDYWIEHVFSPIYSLEGEIQYVNIMARPINDRKEAEIKRQESILMIENAARIASIGIIAGGITHEISQPLNAIKVAADGILYWNKQNELMLPEQITRLINRISNAISKIENIIQHMRSYWLESASQDRVEVKVSVVIQRALSLIMQKIRAHDIYLKIEEHKPDLTLTANPLQLEIIINNLIINAIQAIDEKDQSEKVIVISFGEEDDKKYISVADSGIGLPKDVSIDKLFEPFFSTKKQGKGTGLGLAIVKVFAQRLGAAIEACNNDMGGATFKILFDK